MAKKLPTESEAIKAWQKLDREAERKGEKPVGAKPLSKKLGIKPYNLTEQVFARKNLTEIKRKHNIRRRPQEEPYTKDQLLEKYHTVVSKYKEIPSWRKVKNEIKISDRTFIRNFKKTNLLLDTVKAYKQWLLKKYPSSKCLKYADEYLKRGDKPKTSSAAVPTKNGSKQGIWEKSVGRREFGDRLGFRNLIYEPIYEAGVVLLFGMVSEELGFSIEWTGEGFPDCIAKRTVTQTRRQQPVRIEFEYMSKDFVSHGHDEKECDLIVCWKNNWKDCPIDVLELSKAIKNLPS